MAFIRRHYRMKIWKYQFIKQQGKLNFAITPRSYRDQWVNDCICHDMYVAQCDSCDTSITVTSSWLLMAWLLGTSTSTTIMMTLVSGCISGVPQYDLELWKYYEIFVNTRLLVPCLSEVWPSHVEDIISGRYLRNCLTIWKVDKQGMVS